MLPDQTQTNLTSRSRQEKIILFLLGLILVNLLLLDIKMFAKKEEPSPKTISPQPSLRTLTTTPVLETVVETEEEDFCPPACLETITQATASTLTQPSPIIQPAPSQAQVKEFYIPLGSSSTSSSSWVELKGIESLVDLSHYPGVESVIFEASIRIPTANGRAYAKLYNVTDQSDVWGSEVYAEGKSGYRAESGELTLSPYQKLYRVMMKSSLGYEAILDSARIKIIVE